MQRFRPSMAVGALLSATLALAACSSVGFGSGESSAPQPSGATLDGDLPLGALSSRTLASGECGLFLWSRTPSPQLVFFSNPGTGRAAIALDGRELTLTRLAVDGPTDGGRGAQTFATDSGDVSVRLTIQETEPVESGYRVPSASLRVTVENGWNGVVATAGLAACQP